jgi:hypothetical protein
MNTRQIGNVLAFLRGMFMHTTTTVTLMLVGALASHPAHAVPMASYDIQKVAFWNITNPADPAGGAFGGPGTYRYATHAFAEDKHGRQHNDSPQTGAAFGPLAERLVPNGGNQNATVRDSNHNWTSLVQFNQLGGNQIFGPFQSAAQSLHPNSTATAKIEYDQQALLRLPPNTAGAAIRLTGNAAIQNLPLHPPETAYAEAKSAAEVNLKGRLLKAAVIDGKAPVLQPRFIQGATTLRGEGNARAVQIDNPPGTPGLAGSASFFRDPLSLAFYDEQTGDLIAGENLFEEAWLVQGNGGITYDPNVGLMLTASDDSLASLNIETLSSWILNPFNGSASIENGVFQATGDLALLPWVVTSSSDTQAFLALADLLDFDFMVEATGLGTPTNDLIAELSNEADGLADVYLSVPEPSTLSLVGFAALIFVFSSRRMYTRGVVWHRP